MDSRFLLRICPGYKPSVVYYWVGVLGMYLKCPKFEGEIIKSSSRSLSIQIFWELIAKNESMSTRSTLSQGSYWSSPSQGAFSMDGVSTQLFLPLWKFLQCKKIVRFHNRSGKAGGAYHLLWSVHNLISYEVLQIWQMAWAILINREFPANTFIRVIGICNRSLSIWMGSVGLQSLSKTKGLQNGRFRDELEIWIP